MKNRLPEKWRDVKDQKYTGDITIQLIDRFGKPVSGAKEGIGDLVAS